MPAATGDPRPGDALGPQDLHRIRGHGLSEDAVRRQLDLLRRGSAPVPLDRPCTVGDGILRLGPEDSERLDAAYHHGRRAGRFSKFVPASGAASRMFRDLRRALDDAPPADAAAAARRFLERLPDLPFAAEVATVAAAHGLDVAALRRRGDLEAARALLPPVLLEGPPGGPPTHLPYLGLASRAKALVPFHRSAGEARTPLAEHLDEAAEHLLDQGRRAAVHFTIPQHSELEFREATRAVEARLERVHGARFDVSFSIQRPETDTVALLADEAGGLLRDADGRLVFRPGGHGSLLPNLGALGADLVFIRNIDNVQPIHRRPEVVAWNRRLGGHLLELEAFLVETLAGLDRGLDQDDLERALRRTAAVLQAPEALDALELTADGRAAALARILDRPLRVAGVVPNAGEPGGGPFWARASDAAGGRMHPQIVEAAQIDRADPAQAEIVRRATHFNPVHMVCRLRDHRGQAYDLDRFVDPDAYFVTRKSSHGRPLLGLEHPGLWNGAMAGWNTVFVEVPAAVFAPVKTVFDLLRPAHQPA